MNALISFPYASHSAAPVLERSVYQQSWWMEIAGQNRGPKELTVERGGQIVGVMPLDKRRVTPFRLHFSGIPALSHIGEPLLDPRLSPDEKRSVLCELIQQISLGDSSYYVVSPHNNDRELIKASFRAAGFEHTLQTTFWNNPEDTDILDEPRSKDKGLNSKHRSQLRKALAKLDILPVSAADFVAFYQKNLNAQSPTGYLKSGIPLDTVRALIEKGQELDQIHVWGARRKKASPNDADPPLDAAVAIASDKMCSYYWLSTYRRDSPNADGAEKPNPYATRVLIVHAARFARARNLVFDADGVPDGPDGWPDEGKLNLYRITGFLNQGDRDMYTRNTRAHALYLSQRPRLKRLCREVVPGLRRRIAGIGLLL